MMEAKYKALIVTGQNNHNWKASFPILKQILEQTGLFTVDVAQSPASGENMNAFSPNFSNYSVVVIDYNGDSWPYKTRMSFEKYVKNGGGVVIYHAGDNSFPEWEEYNLMAGLGGWGNRTEKDGPYVYYSNNKMVYDTAPGSGGSHGQRHEYVVKSRNQEHPILRGLSAWWMHGSDELYDRLRGPAKNMDIIATAYSDAKTGGTGRDEPVLMTIGYGKGRIFHTVLGHADEGGGPAMQCVGFIVTFQRGTEWAASGEVTQKAPFDFPCLAQVSLRPNFKEATLEEDLAGIVSYDISKSTRSFVDLQKRLRCDSNTSADLLKYEKLMVDVLKNKEATVDGKKQILSELSRMGSDVSIPVIKEMSKNSQLKDAAKYALDRLQPKR